MRHSFGKEIRDLRFSLGEAGSERYESEKKRKSAHLDYVYPSETETTYECNEGEDGKEEMGKRGGREDISLQSMFIKDSQDPFPNNKSVVKHTLCS